MKKTIIILVAVVMLITCATAYMFAQIGWNQAKDTRDCSQWQVWIDDDYNVCITDENDYLYIFPWQILAATPDDFDDHFIYERDEQNGD